MKKEAELTPQEKQEKAWTQKRIHYHNMQAKGVTVWKEQAQDVLEQKMDEAKLIQIFEPLHVYKNCLFALNWHGYAKASYEERRRIYDDFNLNDFKTFLIFIFFLQIIFF